MGYDIFVSYSTKDKHFVDALVHGLETEGLRCWYAPRDIMAGMTWPAAISQAIQDIPLMLLVFSSASNQSAEISRELTLAASKGRMVIPVRIENVAPGAELEYHLTNRHWLDVYDLKTEAAIERVLAGLRDYAARFGQETPHIAPEREPTPKRERKTKALVIALLALLLLGAGGYFGYLYVQDAAPESGLKAMENASVQTYSSRSGEGVQVRIVRLAQRTDAPQQDEFLLAATGMGGPLDGRSFICVREEHFNGDLRYFTHLDGKKQLVFAVDHQGRAFVRRPSSDITFQLTFDATLSDPGEAAKLILRYHKE